MVRKTGLAVCACLSHTTPDFIHEIYYLVRRTVYIVSIVNKLAVGSGDQERAFLDSNIGKLPALWSTDNSHNGNVLSTF